MKPIDFVKYKEDRERRYDHGLIICLSCGENIKSMVEIGADKRALECTKCHDLNSIFIDIDILESLFVVCFSGEI